MLAFYLRFSKNKSNEKKTQRIVLIQIRSVNERTTKKITKNCSQKITRLVTTAVVVANVNTECWLINRSNEILFISSIQVVHTIQLQWNKSQTHRAVPPSSKNGTECKTERDGDGRRKRVRAHEKSIHLQKDLARWIRDHAVGDIGHTFMYTHFVLCSAVCGIRSAITWKRNGYNTNNNHKKIKVQTDAIFIFFRFSFADELMIDATRVNIATLTPVRAHTYAPARHALTTIGA